MVLSGIHKKITGEVLGKCAGQQLLVFGKRLIGFCDPRNVGLVFDSSVFGILKIDLPNMTFLVHFVNFKTQLVDFFQKFRRQHPLPQDIVLG